MSSLKRFPVDVVVYIDTDTPLGQLFTQAPEDMQREVAVDTLRMQLARNNAGSDTCRMAIDGEDPGFPVPEVAEAAS
jgi:hypothetical protein